MSPSPQRPVLTGSARSGWLRFRTSARTDRRPGRGSAVSRVLVVAMVVISCVLALGASPVMAQPGSAPAATPTNGTDATGDQTGDQPGDQPGDQSDPGDVADLRTRFSQSFLQASGQVEQEISEQPVNYRDEEGAWQPIDSSLVPSDRPGYAVENAANDFDVFIPSDVDAKPVRVQDDSGWVTFNPTAATGAPDVDDSSATFDATATNTGFDYEVEPTGLKESIQLAAAPSAAPVFHYALQMATGLTPHLDGSGAVIVSAADGELAYTIPAPFMVDSAAPQALSDQVQTTLTDTGAGWDYTIRPDFGWLTSPDRAYPVLIDPTVTPTTNQSAFAGSRDCWIGNASPTTSHCTAADGATSLWAGTDSTAANATVRRSLMKFDMSTVPAGVNITGAQLSLYLDSSNTRGTTANPVDYLVRRLTMGWTNNATWNKNSAGSAPTDSWTTPGAGADSDLTLATKGLHGGPGEDGWQTWTLTVATVRGWYNGTIPNDGMLLKQTGGETANNELAFKSGDTTGSNFPKLVITYNTPPTTPKNLAVSPCIGACSTASTSTLTPTLSATSTDNDGGTLTYTFNVTTPSGGAVATSGPVTAAAGSPAAWPVPAGKLSDDSSYQFTVSVSDGTDTAGPTAVFPFTTDTDKLPAIPTGLTETPCKPALCADKVPAGTPATVMSVTPTLSATLSDPDTPLGSLYGDFQVRAVGTTTPLVASGSVQPNTTTGVASFTVPAALLTDGGHYEFQVGDRDATSTVWTTSWIPFNVALDQIASVPTTGISPCLSTCSTWTTDSTTPNFTATSTDTDDSSITYHFEITKPDGTAVTKGKLTNQTPGNPGVWKTPVGALSAGTYQVRMGAADDVQEGATSISWTAFRPFVVQYPSHTPTQVTSCPAITTHVTWTQAGSPYVLHCNQGVSSGGVLELQPGTVVKMAGGSIDVQDGQLNAHGSADYPIIFTSYADDTQLGDTNGVATVPAAGDWVKAIQIGDIANKDVASSTAESTISNVAFVYGGGNDGGQAGDCHGSSPVIKVLRWGRVNIGHDDFQQLQCNGVGVDNQSGDGIGSVLVHNSYFESTIGGSAFDQFFSGTIKDNVLASSATLSTSATSRNSLGTHITGNYIGGSIKAFFPPGTDVDPDTFGIDDNSFSINGSAFVEPSGISDMYLVDNWWGFVPLALDPVGIYNGTNAYTCVPPTGPFGFAYNSYGYDFCTQPLQTDWMDPNGGYANQIAPVMTAPPPFPDAGLQAAPAVQANVVVPQQFGTGSENAQRASGEQDDPVNSLIGSYTETDGDAQVAGTGYPLSVTRTYNSLDTKTGPLGKGWTWNYEANLNINASTATYTAGDGQQAKFTLKNGSWVPATGVTTTLSQSGSNYQILTRAGVTYTFNSSGVLQSILDRNNQGVTLSYSGGHVATASSSGRTITFGWTGNQLTKATLDDGRYVQYTYTGSVLTGVRNLAAATTVYGYDAQNRLHTEANAASVTTLTIGYDSTTGRVNDEADALGHHTTFGWDPVELASTVTDPAGGKWVDDYNPDGTLFARVDPKGRCTFYTFDTNQQLTSMTTPRGEESTYHYNAAGDMIASHNQNGQVTTTYNTLHLPTRTTDAKGTTSDYGYDSNGNGNLQTVTDTTYKKNPNGNGDMVVDQVRTHSFSYWPDGQVKTSTNARGTTTYGYDANGDLSDITTPELRHTHYGYDTTGRQTSVVDPRGYDAGNTAAAYTTTISYTPLDQVLKVTDPLNHSTTNGYDPQTGRLMTVTDAKSHVTSYGYYNDGHLHTVTAPGTPASVTTYTYDADNNVKKVTDPDNRDTTYNYDAANEVTSEATPLGTYTYGYDNDGRVTSAKRPGDTSASTYQFNNHGDLVAVDYPGGSTNQPDVAYTYDIHGDRTSMVNYNAAGAQISTSAYSYDGFDELTSAATTSYGPGGTTTDNYGYGYDAAGALATSTGPGGSRSYGYYPDGLLKSVHKATEAPTPDDLIDYTYNSAGAPKTATAIDGSHQTFGYDAAGRLTSHSDLTAGGQRIIDDAYGLDEVGNPASITHHTSTGDKTDTYTYDARNQLTEVCYNNTSTTCAGATDYVSWTYDAAGNRTQETRPAGTTNYAYDPTTGKLTGTSGLGGSHSYGYNGNGELTSDGTTGYGYNPDGTVATQTTAGVTTAYTYDGDGRRLAAKVGTTGAANTITRESWDPQTYQLTAEFDGANTLLRDYSYGLGPVGYSTNTGTGSNYTLHTDAQGSVVATTGQDGATDATTTYEPYGVIKAHQVLDATAPASPIGWAGQYTDPDGQSNLRARLYDPTTGSFHTPDPAGATTASATYTYGDSNPMVYADPSGLVSASDVWNGIKQAATNPGDYIRTAVGNAAQHLGLCHGSKGACGAAILNVALKITVAVVAVVAITIATDGIGDALLASAADEAITTGIEGELAGIAEDATAGALEDATEGEGAGDLLAGCGLSFTADTRVVLADGKTKPMSKVKVGDKVLATNTRTGHTRARVVKAVLLNHDTDLRDLVVVDNHGHRSVVHTTAKHPIWDHTTHRWVRVRHLTSGHLLQTEDQHILKVAAVRLPRLTSGDMWDLTIAHDHDFYVMAGKASVLVHNCDITNPRSFINASRSDVEAELSKNGWVLDSPTSGGGGVRWKIPGNRADQVRIMPGRPWDPNPIKQGPYIRFSIRSQKYGPFSLLDF